MILAKLKETTRPQHEGLENTVDVMNRMFSIEDYKTLLLKFYRFYSTVEPALAKFDLSASGYDLEARRKLPRLEKDLENLGILDRARQTAPWKGSPQLDTIGKAFGSLYVFEGATLGGQIITRHLKEQLGLNPENGGAFFRSYGERTGEMWKEFGRIITEFAEKYQNDEEIINGAVETFDGFAECFRQEIESQTAGK